MSRINIRLFTLISILFTIVSPTVYAQEETTIITTTPTVTTTPEATATTVTTTPVVEKRVIITAVPAPKETIATPAGYANCFTVAAGWYQDIWVAEHRVCQYSNMPSGVAWVEGYWSCTKYDIPQSQCTTWEWKSARWEKTLVVY